MWIKVKSPKTLFLFPVKSSLVITTIFNANLLSEILQYSLENTVKTSFCRRYIIDNFRINEGIPKAFESCYESYKNWQTKIDINSVIGFLVEINQQEYIDLKLAVMLMAYESLLFKYLLNQGLSQDKIGENIQQKLGQINICVLFLVTWWMICCELQCVIHYSIKEKFHC